MKTYVSLKSVYSLDFKYHGFSAQVQVPSHEVRVIWVDLVLHDTDLFKLIPRFLARLIHHQQVYFQSVVFQNVRSRTQASMPLFPLMPIIVSPSV